MKEWMEHTFLQKKKSMYNFTTHDSDIVLVASGSCKWTFLSLLIDLCRIYNAKDNGMQHSAVWRTVLVCPAIVTK